MGDRSVGKEDGRFLRQEVNVQFTTLLPWQRAAIFSPYTHFAMLAGVAGGKTFTGSHFALKQIIDHPELTGLIGANNYGQLSTATLREFFFWLNEYKFDYVVDRRPPRDWDHSKMEFKHYDNILTVRNPWNGKCTTIFTRIMSDPNPIRGIQISWFWLDEVRDTKQEAHDVLLSRLRESDYIKTLVTTTTNGDDWVFKRFVKAKNPESNPYLYGSMHVETYESVKAGIITEAFYQSMLASYSPRMAEQELFAKHVNVNSGRTYYASSEANRRLLSPLGSEFPDLSAPLVVGCDFNFSPSPCAWIIGQLFQVDGELSVHWFEEISEIETSTPDMTRKLVMRFPDFHYRIFGDASGTRGSTSNQGETDYILMQQEFNRFDASYSIDVDPANPRVKDRVENMNRLLCNSLGEIHFTYNPHKCPLLDQDFRLVGWKNDKLDSMGDVMLTHASDAAGYACYKILPPAGQIIMTEGMNIRRIGAE